MKLTLQTSFVLALLAGAGAQAAEPLWQQALDEENIWSRLTFAGTLLVASENLLTHIDPATGEQMWQRDDLTNLGQFNVRDITGTPFLAINQHISTVPMKSRVRVLNLTTGETLWDTGEVAGSALGGYPVPGQNLLIIAANLQGGNGAKSGIYLIASKLDSGEELWRTRLGGMGSLPTHTSDTSGFFFQVQDFSGHPQPVITDDTFILVAGDLIAVDLASGAEKWRYKLKASVNGLKQTYAPPVLANGTLYAVDRSSLHAIDAATGTLKWKVKIAKAAMPQLQLVDNLIVGRMGGTFSNSKDLVQQKPFGAFAVDIDKQSLAWKWTKAKDSITNLQIAPEQALVLLADKKNLYALDLNASKKGKVVYKEALEFKRKMGKADVAAKGIGAVGGFLGGGLSSGFKGLGGGGDRGDPPLDIEVYDDQLIVRAQYHVLAHNLEQRTTDWSIESAPPRMSSFALIAMGAVTTTMVLQGARASRASAGSWSSRGYLDSALNISDSFQNSVAARYAAAEKARNIAFFLTVQDEDMVLVGIDLSNGAEVGSIPMAEKAPQFMVDAIGSRIYYFKDKKDVLAYDF